MVKGDKPITCQGRRFKWHLVNTDANRRLEERNVAQFGNHKPPVSRIELKTNQPGGTEIPLIRLSARRIKQHMPIQGLESFIHVSLWNAYDRQFGLPAQGNIDRGAHGGFR